MNSYSSNWSRLIHILLVVVNGRKFKIKNYSCSIEYITLISSIFFVITCNLPFWAEVVSSKDLSSIHIWTILLCLAIAITGAYWFLLLLVINSLTLRWFMPMLFLITSLAVYFISTFYIYIDPSMIVNVVRANDWQQSREFLQWRMIPYVLFLGVLPSWFICRVKTVSRHLIFRFCMVLLSLCMLFGGAWAVWYDYAPVFRERREILYLCTPLNIIYSVTKTYLKAHQDSIDKIKIGEDAHQISRLENSKPRVIILVVGETVRASNWGLNNYSRQTTPELAKHHLINFTDVKSCGTSTAISLPCMFSNYGQHDYNRQSITNSESLLHVLNRAGIAVLWRDNQSGCQGVCDGLPAEHVIVDNLCNNGRCLDEVLLYQLKERILAQAKDQIIILHMLGNHGPAYFDRYPQQFKRWLPTCETTDLASCPQKSIINTYDNAILYTDSILAHAIDLLATIKSYDTGLIYLSDHGESLGEHNLFLHGLPYFIAPDEQKKVPMLVWLSKGLSKRLKIGSACLLKKQANPISHDYLFSTVLGLLEVETSIYNSEYDLCASCHTVA